MILVHCHLRPVRTCASGPFACHRRPGQPHPPPGRRARTRAVGAVPPGLRQRSAPGGCEDRAPSSRRAASDYSPGATRWRGFPGEVASCLELSVGRAPFRVALTPSTPAIGTARAMPPGTNGYAARGSSAATARSTSENVRDGSRSSRAARSGVSGAGRSSRRAPRGHRTIRTTAPDTSGQRTVGAISVPRGVPSGTGATPGDRGWHSGVGPARVHRPRPPGPGCTACTSPICSPTRRSDLRVRLLIAVPARRVRRTDLHVHSASVEGPSKRRVVDLHVRSSGRSSVLLTVEPRVPLTCTDGWGVPPPPRGSGPPGSRTPAPAG